MRYYYHALNKLSKKMTMQHGIKSVTDQLFESLVSQIIEKPARDITAKEIRNLQLVSLCAATDVIVFWLSQDKMADLFHAIHLTFDELHKYSDANIPSIAFRNITDADYINRFIINHVSRLKDSDLPHHTEEGYDHFLEANGFKWVFAENNEKKQISSSDF